MEDYTLIKQLTIDIDQIIRTTTNIKDLFLITCTNDTDNITLLNAKCDFIYKKILEIEAKIQALERQRL